MTGKILLCLLFILLLCQYSFGQEKITTTTKQTVQKIEELKSWGMYRQDFPDTATQPKPIIEKGPDFPAAPYLTCMRRLHEVCAYPYEDESQSYFNGTLALVGKNKDMVAIPMAEEQGSIIFISAKSGIFKVDFKELENDGRFTPDKWKSLALKDRPAIIKLNDTLYLGNELDLHIENIGIKLKSKTVTATVLAQNTQLLENIHQYTIYFLEDFYKHYQSKLNSSRSNSQYDYHGLMEISALAQCLNQLGEDKFFRTHIESVMDKITPSWKKNIKKETKPLGAE